MKKRIFTLFAFSMLLSGMFSVAKAQTPTIRIDSVTITNTSSCGSNGVIYESNLLDADSEYMYTPTLYIRAILTSSLSEDTVINIKTGGAAQYLGFPDTVILKKFTFTGPSDTVYIERSGEAEWNMPNAVSGTVGSISASLNDPSATAKDTSFVFYNLPTVNMEFYSPTVQFPGRITLSMEGGADPKDYTRYIRYSTAGYDGDFKKFTDKFDDTEISILEWTDTIYVFNSCQRIAIPLSNRIIDPEKPEGTNPILRAVRVADLKDAHAKELPRGTFYVTSTKDLKFTLVLTGENVGKVPVLKTDRKILPEGVEVLGKTWTREKNADGTFTIVINTIQEPFTIDFDFEDGDDNASDDITDNNTVWSANGQLYVTSAVAANANVYSATGALVKTVALTAGETVSTSLPTGFYIVTLDDNNSYKVVVR